jgi:hypothetical protein
MSTEAGNLLNVPHANSTSAPDPVLTVRIPLGPPVYFSTCSIEPRTPSKIPSFAGLFAGGESRELDKEPLIAPGERVFLQRLYTVRQRYRFRNAIPIMVLCPIGPKGISNLSRTTEANADYPCCILTTSQRPLILLEKSRGSLCNLPANRAGRKCRRKPDRWGSDSAGPASSAIVCRHWAWPR